MGTWKEEPLRELPRYNMALGPAEATLAAPPPFNFPGVTARIFPLRASLNILSAFCDRYLNVAPNVCELRPYLPCVLLVVLDYGRMAIEESNMGWVSQHEVYFEVPLGMWRRDRLGRRHFVKWVVNTPFIGVDCPSSLTTGREVYGWPKVLARLSSSPEHWLIDPRNPLRLLNLNLKGLIGEDVPLLDIDQRLAQNASLAPPELGLLNPFEQFSRLNKASWSIGFGLAEILLGAPLSGFRHQYPGERRDVLLRSLRRLAGFYRGPGVNALTLKQFRDAADPTQSCYQALVESRLSITRFNRGGMLGLYNLLQGDMTGGFRIRLHHNPAFPVVESLGLEVVKERLDSGHTVSILEPFFPFWMSVDLAYGKGETLCWRMRGSPWYRKTFQASSRPSPQAKTPYNTFAGAAAQVWYGPFVLPEARFDVFPLPARPDQLYTFLKEYLEVEDVTHDGQGLDFDVDGRHVYMIASRNRMFSLARSGAWIEACQIAFCVPIRLQYRDRIEHVLATPFAFVDNPTLAMTLREVQGVPAMDATIEAPSRFWEHDGPMLRMDVDVFTALDAGLRFERRKLLEVVRGPRNPPSGEGGREPGPVIRDLFDRPFEPVTLGRLMLKQFRDATEPDRACYQSLVLEPWTLSNPRSFRWLDGVTAISIYRYPSLPLVEKLGLQCDPRLPPQEINGSLADVLYPENPFRIKLDAEVGLGEVLLHTADALPWTAHPDSKPPNERVRRSKGIGEILGESLAAEGFHTVLQALRGRGHGSIA